MNTGEPSRFASRSSSRGWLKVLSATAAGALLLSGLSVVASAVGGTSAPAARAATLSDKVDSVAVGGTPVGVAVYDGTAYVAATNGDITYVDTSTNEITDVNKQPETLSQLYGPPISMAVSGATAFVSMGGTSVPNPLGGQIQINPPRVMYLNILTSDYGTVSGTSGVSAQGIASSPDGSIVYAVDSGAGTVLEIDPTSNSVSKTLTLSPSVPNPSGIGVSPDGSTLYVTSNSANTVSLVNAVTGSVTGSVAVGNGPTGVGVGSDGTVYVANNKDGTVSVVDPSAKTESGTETVGSSPQGVAVSGNTVYVANSGDGTLSAISLNSGTPTPTPTQGTVSTDPANGVAIADGKTPVTVSVTVKDADGNPVSGVSVAFAAPNASAAVVLSSPTATTNAEGVAQVTVTSTIAGSFTVEVSADNVTFTPASAPVVFTVCCAPPVSSWVSVDSSTPVAADGTASHTVTATVVDSNGNPVGNQQVDFAVVSGSAKLSAESATTNANGAATVTVTDTVAESATVSASVNGQALQGSPVTVTFTEPTPFASQGTVSIDSSDPVNPNGTASHTVTVTVKDANGNPVSGVTVSFASSAGATLSSESEVTDASGQVTVSVTATAPGSYTVTPSADGVTFSPASVEALFVPPVCCGPAQSTWTVTPSGSVVADGTASFTGTVLVNDPNGNPVSAQPVLVDVPAGVTAKDASGAVLKPDTDNQATIITDTSGKATVAYTSTKANTYQVGAYIPGSAPAQIGSDQALTFVVGAVDAAASTLAIDSAKTVVADGASTHTVTATVTDANGNPIQGVTVNLTSTGGALSSSSATTNAEGVATVTITATKAGSYEVAATVDDTSLGDSPVTANFIAGSADAASSTLTATPGAVTADGTSAQSVTATVTDANGNPVAGQSVLYTVSNGAKFSNGTATITVASSPAGTAVAQVTSTTAGTYTVTATIENVALKNSPVTVEFANGAASATQSTFTVSPAGPIPADGKTAYTATVTALDANKNPVPNQEVNFTVPSGLTGPATATANGTGVATATFTATVGGTYSLVASIGSDAIATKSLVFQAVAKPAAPVVNPTNGRTASGTATPGDTITITDGNGNKIGTATVATNGNWSVTLSPVQSGGATITVVDTNPAGVASDPTSVTVVVVLPPAPTVFSTNGTVVTGVAQAGLTVTVTAPAAAGATTAAPVVLCTTKADATTGIFSCTPSPKPATGTVLSVTVTDASGNVSNPVTVTVATNVAPVLITPVNNLVTTNQTPTFSGAGAPGDTIQVTGQGQLTCTTTVPANGLWSCTATTQAAGTSRYLVKDTTLGTSTSVAYTTTVVDRIQGPDRYTTAAAAAQSAFPDGASTVFVAKGTNYPDALSAVPAAAHLNAPVLLTQTETLTGATLAELNALHPSRVIVLGTAASVSDATFNQISSQVASVNSVVRIGGVDRYATSRLLAQYVWGSAGASTVFTATGQTYTDAEAAATAAAKLGAPLILVNGNASGVDSDTTALFKSLGVRTIHAVGNTTTLVAVVYSGLAALGTTDRISGANPDATSIAVSQAFFPAATQVFIARDDDFADALTGGAAAAKVGAPLLLTTTQTLATGVSAELTRLGETQVHVMGDPNSITASTMNTIVSGINATQ